MKINEVRHLLTYACNLGCKHCYLNAGSRLDAALPATELTREALDNFYGYFRPEVVSATGGEPLLKPELVRNLAASLNSYGGALEVVTNGFFLTGELLEELKGLNPKVFFQISLDGEEAYHNYLRGNPGAYAAALAAIRLASDSGLVVKARLTASDDNIDQLPGVIRALDALESPSIKLVIRPVIARGRAGKHGLKASFNYASLEGLKELPRFIQVETTDNVGRCGCGVNTVAVDPQGNIYPCTYFTFNPAYRMGTIWGDPSQLGEQAEFAAFKGSCYARHLKGKENE